VKGIPTVIDLFSGAGGFSLGFHAAGCRILAAVDIDESAGQTFEHNFTLLQPDCPPRVHCGDEGNLEEVDLGSVWPEDPPDILIGGPPCQGFSRIGRGKLDSLSDEGFAGDPRNALYRRFLDAVALWRPPVVLMENVPGMLSVKGINVADRVAEDLVDRGYDVGYSLLNAVWYGVPQYRQRIFFLGYRNGADVEPRMPAPTHHAPDTPLGYTQVRIPTSPNLDLPFIRNRKLEVEPDSDTLPAVSVGDALDDLPDIVEHLRDDYQRRRGDFRLERPYTTPPCSAFGRLARHWPDLPAPCSVVDHAIRFTPRDFKTFRLMKPGDRYPAALEIARRRFSDHLEERAGAAPAPGTNEYRELEMRFVPPYPEEKFVDKWRKLDSGQPSWTVPAHLAKDAYSHIHHDSRQARAISIREAARLQSFPDAFLFHGNMGDCFRQIGNAVPPLLAWALASEILDSVGYETRTPAHWLLDSGERV